ncbi:MAG: Fur family transcriptional regulator [Thermodesulfobacteriota bacterium]
MDKILNKYKGTGFKLTPQRLAILKYLEGNRDHPSAEEIFSDLKETNPTLSFATVYNTVQALIGRGELCELSIDPERRRFDPDASPHHHIRCTSCGRIDDVMVDYSASLELPDDVLNDFEVEANHVDFFGVCNNCR